MSKIAYDADCYGWANEQAALLRAGKLGEAAFPQSRPRSFDDILNPNFWPQ